MVRPWTGPERRTGGDRRESPTHGRRKDYQAGCRCRSCRRAEALYRHALRLLKAKGQQPLGALISARATWRLIVRMRQAGYRNAQIARFMGLKRPILDVHPEWVEVGTHQRVLAAFGLAMAEGPDTPE